MKIQPPSTVNRIRDFIKQLCTVVFSKYIKYKRGVAAGYTIILDSKIILMLVLVFSWDLLIIKGETTTLPVVRITKAALLQ